MTLLHIHDIAILKRDDPADFWYIATPYSKYPAGIQQAFVDACFVAAEFAECGVSAFCPIAHSHPIAIHGAIEPLDHDIWLPFDSPMMHAACGLIVVHMTGWEESYGIPKEIETFERLDKPIIHLDPEGIL